MSTLYDKIKRAAALLLAGAMVLLAGCGESSVPEPEETPVPSGGIEGDALSVVEAADDVFSVNCDFDSSMNPYVSRSSVNRMFLPLIYETMFELNNNFELSSDFVTDYYSEDGINWVFLIDPEGVMFHNGDPLSAHDLSYSVQQAMNSTLYRNRMANVLGVSAPDDTTLYITLREPNMLFPMRLDIPIIEYGSVTEATPVGTGPYMYSTDKDRLVLFNDYRDAANMPIDAIWLKDYSAAEESISAFENSLIDIVVNDRTGVYNLGYGRANEKRYYDTLCMHYIGFNTEESYTQFTNHRVATTYAIDRSYIVSELMDNCAVAATLPINPNSSLYNETLASQFEFSMDKLEDILDRAGVVDLDMDGLREFMVGGRSMDIELDFIVCSDSSLKVAVAKSIAANLESVGIPVVVHALGWDDYITALDEGEYDMYYGEVQLTPDFDLLELVTEGDRDEDGGSLNFGLKDGYGFDVYVKEYLAATEENRQMACDSMCTYLCEQMPFVVICFERQEVLTHRGVVTGVSAARANVFQGMENWTINMG